MFSTPVALVGLYSVADEDHVVDVPIGQYEEEELVYVGGVSVVFACVCIFLSLSPPVCVSVFLLWSLWLLLWYGRCLVLWLLLIPCSCLCPWYYCLCYSDVVLLSGDSVLLVYMMCLWLS